MKKAIEGTGYQFLGAEGEGKEIAESYEEKTLLRIAVGFIFSLPMMALMLLNIHLDPYVLTSASLPPFIYVSYPIFKGAYGALKTKTLTKQKPSQNKNPHNGCDVLLCYVDSAQL